MPAAGNAIGLLSTALREKSLLPVPPKGQQYQPFVDALRKRADPVYAGARASARQKLEKAANRPTLPPALLELEVFGKEFALDLLSDLELPDEINRDRAATGIALDFRSIAFSLYFGVSDPFINAVWLAYRAGSIPYEVIGIQGELVQLMGLSPNEAKELLAEARGRSKATPIPPSPIERRNNILAAVSGNLPTSEQLKELLHFGNAHKDLLIVLSSGDLKGMDTVPDQWRQFLDAQAAGKRPDWGALWAPVASTLSALVELMQKYCLGVAIQFEPQKRPVLLYLYAFSSTTAPNNFDYNAYSAGPPVDAVPEEKKEAFAQLPGGLQTFYTKVHDGCADIQFLSNGPYPIDHIRALSNDVAESDVFDRGSPPFNLRDVIAVMNVTGSGDLLCIDTTKPSPKNGVLYLHESPYQSKTGIDFLKHLNQAIHDNVADKIPVK